MKTSFKLILLLLFVLTRSGLAIADSKTVELSDFISAPVALHAYLEYLEDPKEELTFTEVASPAMADKFQLNAMPQFIRAGHPLTYWFKVKIHNASEQSHWYFYLASSRYSRLEFFAPDGSGQYQRVLTGNAFVFDSRPVKHQHYAFPFTIAKDQEVTLYLRAHIQAEGLLWMPAKITSPEQLQIELGGHDGLFLSFYAIMACMLLYNLCLYMRLKLRALLFYCITVAADIGVLWSLDGVNFRYLWPEDPTWERLSLAVIYLIALTTHLVFVREILEIPKRMTFLIWPFRALIFINLAGLAALAAMPRPEVALPLIQINGLTTMILILVAVIYGIRRRVPSAKYFLLSEIFFCAGTVTRLTITLGLIPINEWTYYSFHIGYLFEVVLLSLALADRFRLIQEEKEELQRLALHEAESSIMLKDQFLTTISHEMRTPIAGVDAALQLLRDQNLPDKYSRFVDAAMHSTSEMIVLVDKILDFAEVQSGAMILSQTTLNLRSLIEAQASRYRNLCNIKKLHFELDIAADVPTHVTGDPTKIQAIINILLDNAVKYTARGSIGLIVKQVESSTEHTPAQVQFVVRDTGCGIPEEHQHRIFEYFQQADSSFSRQHGGLGIGLSMCKQLTRLLNGSISFYSVPNHGSEFQVRLPLHAPDDYDAQSLADAHGTPAPQKNISARALIVEDNPVNMMVLSALLEKFGMTVRGANNGVEALQYLDTNKVDIVFMDCQMPDLDGFETTRRLRAGNGPNHHVPVIAVTANAMSKDIERCLESGMDDHVKKPIDRQLLYVKIQRLLALSFNDSQPILAKSDRTAQ